MKLIVAKEKHQEKSSRLFYKRYDRDSSKNTNNKAGYV